MNKHTCAHIHVAQHLNWKCDIKYELNLHNILQMFSFYNNLANLKIINNKITIKHGLNSCF